jgi:hypothetical protein
MNEFPYPGPDMLRWMSEMKDALDERFKFGVGAPDGVVSGDIGCIYIDTNGGAGATMYVKESDADPKAGWVAK